MNGIREIKVHIVETAEGKKVICPRKRIKNNDRVVWRNSNGYEFTIIFSDQTPFEGDQFRSHVEGEESVTHPQTVTVSPQYPAIFKYDVSVDVNGEAVFEDPEIIIDP